MCWPHSLPARPRCFWFLWSRVIKKGWGKITSNTAAMLWKDTGHHAMKNSENLWWQSCSTHTQLLACGNAELCRILSRNLCDISLPDTNFVHRNFVRFADTARNHTKSYLFFLSNTQNTFTVRGAGFSSPTVIFFKFRFPTPSPASPKHLITLISIAPYCQHMFISNSTMFWKL